MWTIFKVFIDFVTKLILFSGWFVLFFFWLVACGILGPPPGIKPAPFARGGTVLTTSAREVPAVMVVMLVESLWALGEEYRTITHGVNRMSSHMPLAHFHPHFIHHLVLRVFLSKHTLLNVYCCITTLTSRPAAQGMHACKKPVQHTRFPLSLSTASHMQEPHTAIPHSTASQAQGAILNSKLSNQKHKNEK